MQPKVALVLDSLGVMGGGERVFLSALELFPGAPIFTLVYVPQIFSGTLITSHPVMPTFIDRLPLAHTRYRTYLPLMPLAVEGIDLRKFDLVVSFSYAVAHGVRIMIPGQRHISYTHTPLRYAWRNYKIGERLAPDQGLVNWFFRYFRRWDLRSVKQVDQFAAVSRDIAGWIQRVYHREARVIYPPVDLERFLPQYPRDGSYITVSRLVAHKRIDLIVKAFSRLKLPLTIIGDGPELPRLRRMAAPNITFMGYQSDRVVAQFLNRARAFVSASQEDFGIAMVEAQAAGCPVITLGKGGALETVLEGRTGLFYAQQTPESIIGAVERFELLAASFSPADMVANVQRFSKERFLNEFAIFAGLDRNSSPDNLTHHTAMLAQDQMSESGL
jgi:glycosyltransferase involved in cell wall biosynthesis